MPEILTTNFKTDTTRLFVDDILASDYYVFASGIDRLVSANSVKSKNEFLEKCLFGKEVNKATDVKFMIKYYPWQSGTTYVQYDDALDLEDQKYYAVVGPNENTTSDYRVYKCLNNNSGNPVNSAPNFIEGTPNQVYETADGYVWKYMYVLSQLQFDAYNALGYIPIIPNSGLTSDLIGDITSQKGSQVSDIIIENVETNFGYKAESGALQGNPFPAGAAPDTVNAISTDGTWNPINNYYAGQSVYFTNPNGTSFLHTITSYEYITQGDYAVIKVDGNLTGVNSNAIVKILPRVEILGDGKGAQAIANVNDGKIDSITIINGGYLDDTGDVVGDPSVGDGYNNISVRIVDPAFDFNPEDPNSVDSRAVVRGILSPKGGHGSNLLDELKCKHFLLYAYIRLVDNNLIGATNNYSSIGIVKNPQFDGSAPTVFDNRIAVTTDDIAAVVVNTIVNQFDINNNITFKGKVHEIDEENNTFYIAEYNGPYPKIEATDTSLDETKSLRNATGQLIGINSITTSPYAQRTGEVYFLEDFIPLPRTDQSREEFKFVLEF